MDISSILSQMTLEEKAALCTGADAWSTTPIPRLGVRALIVSDGPHGVRRVADTGSMAAKSLPATCFPTAACQASTWNRPLVYAMGQALGEECQALQVGALLGPGVNIKRSPLGGRNFEYYSEDPYLAGELAASLVNGIQSQGVGATLKHFAANNQEFQRFTIDTLVDERTLREIYLAAFETVVRKASPWLVMCAYNKINGQYCSEHHGLLSEILKDEWGFEGLVVSDWGAVHDRVRSLQAGLDWEMPGPKARRVAAVVQAVRSGELAESVLDDSVRRILGVVARAEAARADVAPRRASFDQAAHHVLAQKIAAQGVVLLKNDGLLPLHGAQRIAVIGDAAVHAHFQGGGSSNINPTRVDQPLQELQRRANGAAITFSQGYAPDGSADPALVDQAAAAAREAQVALLFIALPASKEAEGYDRQDLDLTPQQLALVKAVSAAQPRCVVILNNAGPLVMGEWLGSVGAVLEAWLMGQGGGAAVADILFGLANPSGKLAETFPLRLEHTPAYLNFPGGDGEVRYAEGLFVGYRHYEARKAPVQFPFGFGLSYTSFQYSQVRASSAHFNDLDGVTVSLEVTNTGSRAGAEIVQVYVHDRQSGLVRPEKELKGFARVELQPGETKTVAIPLDFRAFAYYHPGYRRWIAEEGEFDLLVGASSADIRGQVRVTLHATQALPCRIGRESSLREWLADPRSQAVFAPLFKKIMANMGRAFGTDENGMSIGMDMVAFIMDMPIASVLNFMEWVVDVPPEEAVEGLLAELGRGG